MFVKTDQRSQLEIRIKTGYVCGYCHDWTKRKNSHYVPSLGKKIPVQICEKCDAWVALHKDTMVPLGTVADSETRHARAKAHQAFDPIWKKNILSRERAYRWLAALLGIERANSHIGSFDLETCLKVRVECDRFVAENIREGSMCNNRPVKLKVK